MIQAVLFDLDGVLTLDAMGSSSITNYMVETTGVDRRRFWKAYCRHNPALLSGTTQHEDIWDQVCRESGMWMDICHLHDAFRHTPMDQTMIQWVKRCKDAGRLTAIATDNKVDRVEAILYQFDMESLFDAVLISAKLGVCKTEQGFFDQAVEMLGCPATACVFIDNAEKNLLVPRAMGMRTVYFDHEKRPYALFAESMEALLAE